MALSPYTLVIGTKSDALNGFNVIPNAPYEIRARNPNGSSGALVNIFSDSAGLVPITQTGATVDSRGSVTFYSNAIAINAQYNNGTPIIQPIDVGVTNEQARELIEDNNTTGIKVTRANNNKHYGWGSTVVLPDGRWMQVFRAASTHGTENNTQIIRHYSDDLGISWYGESQIFRQADSDARPDAMYVMANGRIGFIINRATSPALSPYYQPLFFYTDDEGVSWQSVTIPLSSPYTFSAVGGIIDFPASQGGNDTTGFVTFGFASAGALDALTTTNNGESWSIVNDIHGFGPVADSMSETCYTRLGTTDRWLIYGRARLAGANTNDSIVFSTTNLLSWGVPVASNVLNKGTPPACAYNEETDEVDLYVVARGGKDLYDYDNALLVASEDAETLWAANGVYTGYPARIAELPNWFTGYLYPFKSGIKTYFTMMFGENPTSTNGSTSAVAVLSDVPTSSADASTIAKIMNHYIEANNVSLIAQSNVTTEAALTIENAAQNISSNYGAYEDRHNMGGIEYLTYMSDDYRLDVQSYLFVESVGAHHKSQDIILGSSDNVGVNGSASVHLNVASSSVPAILSHSDGTASARKHVVFTNPNGIVGSISTSGSATSYTTSSDPRLKTKFEAFSYEEVKEVINNLFDCSGKFQFKTDLSKYIIGFDAHRALDVMGFGAEIGTEGSGPRHKEIGEVYGTVKHYKTVDFFYKGDYVYTTYDDGVYTEWSVKDGVVQYVDGPQPESTPSVDDLQLATVTVEELKVSPAGVDQSKVIPYLLLAVKTLIDKVQALENK